MTVIGFIISLLMFSATIGMAFLFFGMTDDIRMYKSALKSSFENNAKLSKVCQDLIIENKDLHVRFDNIEKLCMQQNDLCESVLKDNIELTARLNEVLMHIDDGK